MKTLLEIQRELKGKGYDVGPLDGIMGRRTEAALRDYALAELGGVPDIVIPISAVAAQPKAVRPIWEIVIHCTATPEGRDVSVDTIRGWHRKNGWNDIGYHYVVALDGTIQPGRPEATIGAHVSGHNAGTIGISYVGGVDAQMQPKDTRTPAQRGALMAVCRALIAKYPSIRKVSGHCDYDAGKACPSFDVSKDPLGSLI